MTTDTKDTNWNSDIPGEENFASPLLIDRAHWSLSQKPQKGERPQALHYYYYHYSDKEKILKLSRSEGHLIYKGSLCTSHSQLILPSEIDPQQRLPERERFIETKITPQPDDSWRRNLILHASLSNYKSLHRLNKVSVWCMAVIL